MISKYYLVGANLTENEKNYIKTVCKILLLSFRHTFPISLFVPYSS